MSSVGEYTSKRLEAYELFSSDVVERVSETIHRISLYSGFGHFFDVVGIDEDIVAEKGILDIKPKNFDESSALIVHLPMANPLDGNQIYQVATLSRMFPDRRVIAAANPSGTNKSGNQLWSGRDRARVASGDFRFAVPALVDYLRNKSNNLDSSNLHIDQIGASLGADLAVGLALRGTVQVDRQLLVEPASVSKRHIVGLAHTFGSTNKALKEYVEVNNLASFISVREKLGISEARYALGLLRLSNVALTRAIATGSFSENLQSLFTMNNMPPATTVMWGSETEFGAQNVADSIDKVESATQRFIGKLIVPGGKHAMVNDLALMSAAALQTLT